MLGTDKERFLTQLIRHEGARRDAAGRHCPYRDSVGVLTIGYGHNLEANPVPGLDSSSRLTEEQARRLLEADLNALEPRLKAALPWAGRLCSARYGVLLNMAFNLGLKGLLGFKNSLALMGNGNYHGAANSMLASRWAAQVGNRARELAEQMRAGRWQTGAPEART